MVVVLIRAIAAVLPATTASVAATDAINELICVCAGEVNEILCVIAFSKFALLNELILDVICKV